MNSQYSKILAKGIQPIQKKKKNSELGVVFLLSRIINRPQTLAKSLDLFSGNFR